MNPQVTVGMFFNWLPPLEGTPAQYLVAVDNPAGAQISPPGSVFVATPTVKIAMSQFLSGQSPGIGYKIYVRAEDAAGNQGPFLVQPFDLAAIGAPEPAPEPFTS